MKLLASDYDNTLKRGRLDPADLRAIREFRRQGHKFGIVTGRSINMIKRSLDRAKVEYDFIIGINGGMIVDASAQILDAHYIDFSTAEQLITDIQALQLDVCGITDGIRFAYLHRRFSWYGLAWTMVSLGRCSSLAEITGSGRIASFFTIDHRPEQARKLHDLLDSRYPTVNAVKNGAKVIDIDAPGIDKGKAVDLMANRFGCGEIYVIGDAANDLAMIRRFHGFAIAGAEPAVKQAASAVFTDFTELFHYVDTER